MDARYRILQDPQEWLRRALIREERFYEYCEQIEGRWGVNGTERKVRKQYHYHQELIAKWKATQERTRLNDTGTH